MNVYNFLAIDMGATSGRAVAGLLNGKNLEMVEVHRFPNRFIELHGRCYWDVYAMFDEIKKGIAACRRMNIKIHSIGIDTWGVDFGYIGPDGILLGLPRAYRDTYTEGAPEEVFKIIPKEELYRLTGTQIMNFNSLFQLYRAARQGFSPYRSAERILFMPDLLTYMLAGEQICEYTIASTSQMINLTTKQFDRRMVESLGIKPSLLSNNIVMPGTVAGRLTESLAKELGTDRIPVIAVAGHDTASAVAAAPSADANFAFLSSGTWSLMGIETERPIISELSVRNNFTNEGGIEGTTRFLKNITGMWLLEECKREWAREGRDYSYSQIVEMAAEADSFSSIINPDEPEFARPESMCAAIVNRCRATGQKVPAGDCDFVSLIFKSLARRYGQTLQTLVEAADFPIKRLHVIGGGSQNRLLNQMTARETGIPVVAGPAEATAIGNIMLQAKAAGLVRNRWEMREIIAETFKVETFNP